VRDARRHERDARRHERDARVSARGPSRLSSGLPVVQQAAQRWRAIGVGGDIGLHDSTRALGPDLRLRDGPRRHLVDRFHVASIVEGRGSGLVAGMAVGVAGALGARTAAMPRRSGVVAVARRGASGRG